MIFLTGCSGEKHLPSSNLPEYDPKKASSTPTPSPNVPSASIAKPAEMGPSSIQLPPFEAGPNEKGEWKKVPVRPESLQPFNSIKGPCDALTKIVQGLGSRQLFAGKEGQSLKQSLGSQAESVARSLDQQLFENFKAQLGPTVADCPSPTPTHKSRLGKPHHAPRLLLATGPAQGSFQLAQAPAVSPTRSESRQEAPPGWVGWKTTARSIWPETVGNRRSMVTVLGGKVLKCPAPDGVAPGDFEFAVVLDQTTVESGVTRTAHIGLHASATLKGQVGDDAKVKYIEEDLSTVAERNGTDVPASLRRQRSQFRFVPSREELWLGFPTNVTASAAEWDMEGATPQEHSFVSAAIGAVMLWGGQNYLDAEREWHKPNTCVEITFTPPTKTKKFVPSESTPVKTELRTKKEQAIVPAKFKEAKERPRERNGTVSPREDQSQPGTPATFTYQAPATKVQHSGFRVSALSRAGVAEAKDGEWELAPSAYVLEFKSHIVQEPLNLPNPPFGMFLSSNGFDAQVEATVPLRRRDDGQWVGEGAMQYATRTLTQPASCEIRVQGTGTTTFHVNGGSISSAPEPFGVNLIILPGRSGEVAETHCTSSNTPEKLKELFASQGVQADDAHGVTEGGGWSSAFNVTRFRTFNMAKKGYEIGGWTPDHNSNVIAKKTITVTCSIGMSTCREETTLTLRLADEPGATASPPR
ncbi:MAG: hypothetical protein WBK08_16205 [Nitrospira sp.]